MQGVPAGFTPMLHTCYTHKRVRVHTYRSILLIHLLMKRHAVLAKDQEVIVLG